MIFIWHMCISFQKLNYINFFEFPIPCRDNEIIRVGAGSDTNFIISIDARKGYHQVQVRKIDKEKITFFSQMAKSSASAL